MTIRAVLHWGHWTPDKRERKLPLHKNPGLEVVLVTRGEVAWTYAGKRVVSQPNSLVVSWPWEDHGIEEGPLPPCELFWVLIPLIQTNEKGHHHAMIHNDIGLDQKTGRQVIQSLRSAKQRSLPASNLVAVLMREIINEQNRPDFAHQARASQITGLLLIELARLCRLSMTEPARADSQARVAEFVDELENACGEEWTLERMADRCHLGRTQFGKMVSSLSGDPPLRLLNRYRVNRARKLLEGSSESITSIAFACGFNSSQYFARVFREFSGQSPRQIRGESGTAGTESAKTSSRRTGRSRG